MTPNRVFAVRRRSGDQRERGSALLIVFLFAAMVAIMLYMEMPVAVFEAQRQKEQLLVDRGNEYVHAIKLYYRKIGGYPPSVDALENTNRMRFLRHKFKDPFTGKDDWRLLHAGPTGILIDSKVKPLVTPGQNGQTNSTGFGSSTTSSSFGSSTSSFGNSSSFGSNSKDTAPPEVIVAAIPQRPPAISANGAGQVAPTSDGSQNPMTPLLQTGQSAQDAMNPNPGNNPNAGPGGQPVMQPGGGQLGMAGAGQPGTGLMATGTDSTGAIRNLLTNPNSLPGPGTVQSAGTMGAGTTGAIGTTGTTGRTGVLNSGSLAGVASRAGGHSIKKIDDQEDYSLWEFHYDPSKDSARQLAGAQAALQQNPNQTQGQNQNQNQTTGFGTSGFGTTGFGQNPSSSPSQPAPSQPQPGSTMTTGSGPPQD